MSQILIFTGKGGVGKTSVAAAHAALSAGLCTSGCDKADSLIRAGSESGQPLFPDMEEETAKRGSQPLFPDMEEETAKQGSQPLLPDMAEETSKRSLQPLFPDMEEETAKRGSQPLFPNMAEETSKRSLQPLLPEMAEGAAKRGAGKRANTLLVSADMAHNLGDIFQVRAGGRVREIAPGLSLLELDPYLLMREEYPNVNRAVASLSGSAGAALDRIGDGFMIPGFENLFCLLKIRDLYRSGLYDRIIVDCAPTGETLSLLKLPELLSWYVEKFSPVGRMLTRLLTPAARLRYHMELPDGAAMDELGQLFADLIGLQELLKDPGACRVRLVCIPERMVVEETRRSYMYLNLYNYPVDAVFINRILPEKTGSGFMEHWRQTQAGYLAELESVFTELPVLRIPWYPAEVRGMEAVQRFGGSIRVGADAAGISDLFHLPVRTDNEVYERTEDGYRLTVRIPGGEREEVQAAMHGTDLDIRIRNFQRSIPLPGVLRGAKLLSVEVEDGRLSAAFRLRGLHEKINDRRQKA